MFNEATLEQGIEAFEAAGFVAGAAEVLSKTDAKGEERLIVLALQFGSEEGAKNVHEFLHADELKPMPGSCTVNFAEFDVEDIPDATGVARTLSEGGAGERSLTATSSTSATASSCAAWIEFSQPAAGPLRRRTPR